MEKNIYSKPCTQNCKVVYECSLQAGSGDGFNTSNPGTRDAWNTGRSKGAGSWTYDEPDDTWKDEDKNETNYGWND